MYHYCATEAFLSIISRRKLWVSDSRFLNDRREIEFAKGMLESNSDLVKEALKSHIASDVLEGIIGRALSEPFNLFVASFSKSPDKLSQWRSYANYGAGVSIGFSEVPLQAMGYIVREVTYGDNFLRNLVESMRSTSARHSGSVDLEKELFRTLIEVLATSKPQPFFEEEELRLAILTHHVSSGDVRYRARNALVVPYIEVDLAGAWPDAISDIWIGPMITDEMAKESMREFLNQQELGRVRLNWSKTALR